MSASRIGPMAAVALLLVSSVACAPAEPPPTAPAPAAVLPPPSTRAFWTLRGTAVARTTIQLNAGPAACGWEDVAWLSAARVLGQPLTQLNALTYVRDTEGALPIRTDGTFASLAGPPDGAVDTGYRFGDELGLWVIPDTDAFVLVDRGTVWERWPRVLEPFGCT